MVKVIDCDLFEADCDAIIHQVNCMGVMGSGVAEQVKALYPQAYDSYLKACNERESDKKLLGTAQFVDCGKVYVVNLFSQYGYGRSVMYTDYEAMRDGLRETNRKLSGCTVALPYKIGCVRGGGNWEIVSKIIEETLVDCDVLICKKDKG